MPPISRRRFLTAAVSLAGAGALAACGSAAAIPAASSVPPSASAAAKPSNAAPSVAASASPATKTSAPAGAKQVKIAYVTIAANNAPFWLAQATGAFTQRGLDVKAQFIEGNIAAKALVAKEIDLLLQAAAPIITADLNGNADLTFVGSGFNHSPHALNTAASIKSAADLKGKVLGSDRAGSTTEYQNRVILKLLGLKESDVTPRQLGGSDTLLPALMSGQIQGAALSPPQVFQAEAAGYPILIDTWNQPYQGGGWVASKARFAELAPVLPSFLAAYRQGMVVFKQQPDLAKQVIGENTKTTDQALLDKTYDFYLNKSPFELDLQPSVEGIQRMVDFLAETIPAAKTAKAEQFIDRRFIDQVPPL